MKRANLIGKRFGKLTVIEFLKTDKQRRAIWKCKCDCGNYHTASSRHLIGNHVKSCGCLLSLIGENNRSWKGFGEISLSRFNKMKTEAKRRKIDFELNIEYCWALFLKQNRKCNLSGIPIQFQSKNRIFDGNASLDRIDSSKGYITNNVQWLHKDVNHMKWDLTTERFKELIKRIYHNFNKI